MLIVSACNIPPVFSGSISHLQTGIEQTLEVWYNAWSKEYFRKY